MSFLINSCASNRAQTETRPTNPSEVKVLTGSQKFTLTTDLVLSIVAIGAGGLALLSIHGVPLSFFSAIGAMGTPAAIALIGAGGAVILVDLSYLTYNRCKAASKLSDESANAVNEQETHEKERTVLHSQESMNNLKKNLEADLHKKSTTTSDDSDKALNENEEQRIVVHSQKSMNNLKEKLETELHKK